MLLSYILLAINVIIVITGFEDNFLVSLIFDLNGDFLAKFPSLLHSAITRSP